MTEQLSFLLRPTDSFTSTVEHAQLAEQLGYHSIMCTHIAARDSFTTLGALAQHTERIRLTTNVAPIYHRSPASMAQTAATVDDVSGGRFVLGLGTGHRITMGGWHGQEIGKPVAEMREYVAVVRAILAGEPPPEGERWRSNFGFVGFTPRPDIPIYLAGLSPAMLRLAGEIADGVMLWACPADYVRDVVVPEVRRGRERAGKDLDGFTIAATVPASADTNRRLVLDGIRTELHRYFGLPFYRTMFEAAGYGNDLAAYDAAPDRETQKHAISEALIENLCAIGDASDVRRGVERYRAAGATNPILTGIAGTDYPTTLRAARGA